MEYAHMKTYHAHHHQWQSFLKTVRKNAMWLLVAAFLPIIVWAAAQSDIFSYLSRASAPQQLYVWLEPTTIIAKPGEKVTFEVLSRFTNDDEKSIVPFTVSLTSNPKLSLNKQELSSDSVFRGWRSLGSVSVIAPRSGQAIVKIENVNFSFTPTNVSTVLKPAHILVKN